MSHLDPDVAALLALGEDVDAASAAHVAECAECAADVAAFRRAIAAGKSTAVREPLLTPPPRVWDAISAELGLADLDTSRSETGTTRAEPDASQSPPEADAPAEEAPSPVRRSADSGAAGAAHQVPRRRRPRRRAFAMALVAAVAVVAVATGVFISQQLQRERVSVLAAAVLDAFPAHPGAEGEAVLEEADGHTQIVVTLDADVPPDGYREVWLIAADGSDLVSLGVLDGREGTFSVPADIDVARFSLVDISQEDSDGDPGHSGDSIVRGELKSA